MMLAPAWRGRGRGARSSRASRRPRSQFLSEPVRFRYHGAHARVPPALAAAPAPDPGRHDRRPARRGAGGLGPDRPSRRRGAGRRGHPGLRGARPARRHPPDRRLPDAAHRHDDRGGRRAVPVRAPGRRRRARAGHGRRVVAAQGPGRAPGRAARPGEPAARAVPPRRGGLVPARRHGAVARDDRGVACGRACGSSSSTTAATAPSAGSSIRSGIVLKAGNWYLVGGARRPAADLPRLARAGRRAAPRSASVRPDGFDLSAYWTESTAAYEREAPRIEVTLRARRGASRWLEDVIDTPVARRRDRARWTPTRRGGRIRLTLDWPREVAGRLLALGGAVEVLEPPELRAEIAALAAEAAAVYATSARRPRRPARPPADSGSDAERGPRLAAELGPARARHHDPGVRDLGVPAARREATRARQALPDLALAVRLDRVVSAHADAASGTSSRVVVDATTVPLEHDKTCHERRPRCGRNCAKSALVHLRGGRHDADPAAAARAAVRPAPSPDRGHDRT